MNKVSCMKICATLLWLLLPVILPGKVDSLPGKAETDRSEYRKLVLENGLRVILLSDPDLNKSSAALSVDVGSLKDPDDRQGLAHFLEHMLFLGTEKYPSESEYGNYIKSNGGYTNAYTAGDHTNYHFEVGHHAFEGALDRFSQFFIAPLFLEEFTQNEMLAVNSEFEKSLENDFRRIYQVLTHYYKPEHPANHFSTGNLETLKGISREEFINFYDENYSADQMGLALAGEASLDQLERWARKYFSDIPSNGRKKLSYPQELIPREDAIRLIRIRPVKDIRELRLVFGLDATRELWEGKSAEMIMHIIGYEGSGSLLSHLKKKGWATSLGASLWDSTKDYSQFLVSVGLTPEGQKQMYSVMESLFSYIEMMRESEYPHYLFEEKAMMARLEELYSDKGEGASRARFLANQALYYPIEVAERVPYLYVEPDPESYFHILDQLRVNQALFLHVSRDVETDRMEPIYGTEYGFERREGFRFQALNNPTEIDSLALPEPNPYVPEEINVLEMHPVPLIQEPGVHAYYMQDTEFERPRASYVFRVRTPKSGIGLRNAVLQDFYLDILSEVTNEEIYTASMGGATAAFSGNLEGIQFTVSGYSGSVETLLDYVAGQVKNMDLPEIQFEAIKEKRLRDLKNFELSEAYIQARDIQRSQGYNVHFSPTEQIEVAESISLKDVRDYARSLYESGFMEMMIHGNIDFAEAETLAQNVTAAFELKPISREETFFYRYAPPPNGEDKVTRTTLKVNNSCYWQEIVLGSDEPDTRAAAMVIDNFLREPYYTEMRTRQQLGYVVWSYTTRRFQDIVAGLVIQSSDYPAHELQNRSHAFIEELPAMLRGLGDEKFSTIVKGVRANLREEDKSIKERTETLFTRAFTHDGDWNRRVDTLNSLESLTRDKVADILETALSASSLRSHTVLAYARDHEQEAGSGTE